MPHRLKHTLKRLRYRVRRSAAARRWGADALDKTPALLGNAMPKSGSHLIIQVLEGLTELGPFVNPGFPPVNRREDNSKKPEAETLAEVRDMLPGEIRYGYLHGEEPWTSAATGPGRAVVFVYRDPRDWVVSQVFYATDMHAGHMLHEHYNRLPTLEDRINAAIEGVREPGVTAPPLVERYSHYLGWLGVPGVLTLRFEDLILNRTGALERILDYLKTFNFQPSAGRREALDKLNAAISPLRSGTFRKGQPGEWREHFTAENIRRFEAAAGDLLDRLGYESF